MTSNTVHLFVVFGGSLVLWTLLCVMAGFDWARKRAEQEAKEKES